MKKLLPALLLGLAGRSALAAPPTVPATFDALGLHLTLDSDARRLVQAKVNNLCQHPASLEASIALAESAFPLIDQVLAEEGVPADFRYLALQESALLGNAESVHGAVGYWQFKRETALDLGLTVTSAVDERRHLTASTRAAARYLAHNNASLHNWANALLSYNLGLGGVRSYTKPSDANATQLIVTARTNPYILTFIAQKIVFEPACARQAVPFVPWREVPAAPGQSLAQQAAAYTVDPAALARLNPWLLTSTVPQDGHDYTLLVPLNAAAPVAASPPAIPQEALPAPTYLRINGIKALLAQSGDTPASLAERGGASLSFFLKVNEMKANEAIVPGEPYVFQRKKEVADEDYHVVAPGQTLAAVARRYGVLRHALRTYNHLGSDEAVQPGLVLWLSHARPRNQAPEYQQAPVAQPLVAQQQATPAPTLAPEPNAAQASAPAAAAHEPALSETDDLASINETDDTASARETDELASINELPTEVPGPPIASLPTAPPVVIAVPAATPQPTVVAPVAVAPAKVEKVVIAGVPVASPATPAAAPRTGAATNPYLVAPGETLYALARRLGVRPAELAAWNSLPPNAPLRAGQMLHLSTPATAPVLDASASILTAATTGAYVVTAGDTFFSISRRYKCTVAELLAHNGKVVPTLHVGETLRVPQL